MWFHERSSTRVVIDRDSLFYGQAHRLSIRLKPTIQTLPEANIPAFVLDILITILEVMAGLEVCVVLVKTSAIKLRFGNSWIQYQAQNDEQPVGPHHSSTPITKPLIQTKSTIWYLVRQTSS